jgi:hypothetical protein
MAWSTLMPSAMTSGPQWSPANTTMLKVVMINVVSQYVTKVI